ncbi:superinfection immunity protein [Haloferula sp. BvORR071]|uniref:superinfection immunity protein n=1 Tax=Haloferula sp. BvORR071 TaxID=1396141 RepID=UPI000554589E|nr:superinfection immunity protein [Haloferula sp. BvORR071]
METVESLREKFMENKPAPLPQEAYEGEQARRRRKTMAENHAIPKWGWAVVGVALVVVGAATIFAYLGKQALVNSMPDVMQWGYYSVIALAALVVYFLPAIIALNYRVRRSGAVTVMNLLLGFTGAFIPLLTAEHAVTLYLLLGFSFFLWMLTLVWSIAEAETRDLHGH